MNDAHRAGANRLQNKQTLAVAQAGQQHAKRNFLKLPLEDRRQSMFARTRQTKSSDS